jgi:hypothetical protein
MLTDYAVPLPATATPPLGNASFRRARYGAGYATARVRYGAGYAMARVRYGAGTLRRWVRYGASPLRL